MVSSEVIYTVFANFSKNLMKATLFFDSEKNEKLLGFLKHEKEIIFL